jgi:hypothetical protein
LRLSPHYAQEIREYTVSRINSNLTIDGHLDEVEWLKADATDDFVLLGRDDKPPVTATRAKMLWDEHSLYVGIYCQDHNVWATYNKRDDRLYQEDVIEVYIDQDGDGLNYIEIEVNPINTIFDLWLTKPWSSGGQGHSAWNMAGLSTATSVQGSVADTSDTDTAWVCEMAIPFSEMEVVADSIAYPPSIGDVWYFNLFRFDRGRTNDPNREETGWNQTGGGQHVPERFGRIIFSNKNSELN